jgi:T-complex protein 1 subunit delta
MVDGLVFTQNKISHGTSGPTKIQNPKIALIQFCLSPPKTDIE